MLPTQSSVFRPRSSIHPTASPVPTDVHKISLGSSFSTVIPPNLTLFARSRQGNDRTRYKLTLPLQCRSYINNSPSHRSLLVVDVWASGHYYSSTYCPILAFLLVSGGSCVRKLHRISSTLSRLYSSTDELTPVCIAANSNRDQPLSHAVACFALAARARKRACSYAAGNCDGVPYIALAS